MLATLTTLYVILFLRHRLGLRMPSIVSNGNLHPEDRAWSKFPNLGSKCIVDLVATIERNRKRSCSTLRIPRLRSSQRCGAIGQQNGKLFRAWS